MNSKDRDVPEADLLGLGRDGQHTCLMVYDNLCSKPLRPRITEENTMHCGSHAEGIDESEALLAHKREHQIHDRERQNRSQDEDAAARQAEAIRQRRVTGFKTRPSALAGDAPPKRRHSKGSIHDANGSDWEGDEDDADEEWVPDLFVFEYGTVVIWGMTEKEEKRVLASL